MEEILHQSVDDEICYQLVQDGQSIYSVGVCGVTINIWC